MKIALHAGLIGLIIVLVVNSLDYFVESNYSEGKYDIFILYYVIINSLYLEKIIKQK